MSICCHNLSRLRARHPYLYCSRPLILISTGKSRHMSVVGFCGYSRHSPRFVVISTVTWIGPIPWHNEKAMTFKNDISLTYSRGGGPRQVPWRRNYTHGHGQFKTVSSVKTGGYVLGGMRNANVALLNNFLNEFATFVFVAFILFALLTTKHCNVKSSEQIQVNLYMHWTFYNADINNFHVRQLLMMSVKGCDGHLWFWVL